MLHGIPDAVVELLHGHVVHSEETLGSPLLGDLILKIPHAVSVAELIETSATLG